MKLPLALGLIAAALVFASARSFNSAKVFRAKPHDEQQVSFMKYLASIVELDFWYPDSAMHIVRQMEVDFHISADQSDIVQTLMEKNKIPYEVLFPNLQEVIEKQAGNETNSTRRHSYTKYNEWHKICAWTERIAKKYPKLVSRIQIGNTFEKRPMYLLKVGKERGRGKAIFMDCGIHAREWISPAFCQWFVKEATQTYGKDQNMTNILDNMNFYILPVFNIDGYIWSWIQIPRENGKWVGEGTAGQAETEREARLAVLDLISELIADLNRLWRKSRSKTSNSDCVGVDLNRNFNISWGTVDSSRHPCKETYCGTSAESEPETKAVTAFIRNHLSSIKAYLTVHSYSQMLLFPYGYTYDDAPDYNELNEIAKGAVIAISSLYGKEYKCGSSAVTIYPSAGCSEDWAYSQGIKYSFAFELRDKGKYGFLLPESLIKPTCQEIVLAVKFIANYVLNKTL